MSLTGNRIFLRPIEESDLPLLVEWRNAPENWVNFFNKFPLSYGEQQSWHKSLMASQTKKLFMICRSDKTPIGTIGLDHIDYCNQTAEFGNFLIGTRENQGKGFAREALALLLSFCFQQLNLHRIYLFMYEHNESAWKSYESCGFKLEGTLRDARFSNGTRQNLLLMSILRPEFDRIAQNAGQG